MPVDGMFCPCGLVPPPPCLAPKLLSPVAAVRDESHELVVGHGSARNRKGSHLNLVSPLLIIKHESGFWRAAEPGTTAGNFGVAKSLCAGELVGVHAGDLLAIKCCFLRDGDA